METWSNGIAFHKYSSNIAMIEFYVTFIPYGNNNPATDLQFQGVTRFPFHAK